ncbi:MAG: (2Fe-2S)-binding protein [Synechococcus sp.]|nr:(2Fe-2S)-binding protein [Synechococcus sp.]
MTRSPAPPFSDERVSYQLRINGRDHAVHDAWYFESLLDVLRHRLGLTGTKFGCGHGQCGACTVQVDGEPVNACLELAAAAIGREITTIEGYAPADGSLTPLQQCFLKHAALQCGYCTQGFVMAAEAFLRSHPNASEEEIRHGLAGNLCRCTGYGPIIAAVQEASRAPRA